MLSKKVDTLDLLLKITIVPFSKFRIIKYLIELVCFQVLIQVLFEMYELLKAFDKELFMKFSPWIGYGIFMVINNSIVIFYGEKLAIFIFESTKTLLPIDLADINEVLQIKKESRILKIIAILTCLFATLASITFNLSVSYFDEKIYAFAYLPQEAWILKRWIMLTTLLSAHVIMSLGIALGYMSFNARFQVHLLNIYIGSMCASEIEEEERKECQIYQDILKQKLKIAIFWHNALLSFRKVGLQLINMPLFLMATSLYVLTTSSIVDICYSYTRDGTQNYFGIVFYCLSGILLHNIYIFSGQLLINKSEETYRMVCEVPWYTMNAENQRMYFLLLMSTSQPLSIRNPLLELNFMQALRILATIYSYTCVIAKLMWKK